MERPGAADPAAAPVAAGGRALLEVLALQDPTAPVRIARRHVAERQVPAVRAVAAPVDSPTLERGKPELGRGLVVEIELILEVTEVGDVVVAARSEIERVPGI